MKNSSNPVPRDTRYVPLTQQKWCCMPTCIQMVMLKNGLPLVPAELIGHALKLVIPKEDAGFFWNAPIGEMPPSGFGTRLSQVDEERVLVDLGIPLRFQKHLIDSMENAAALTNLLTAIEREDRDALLIFDVPTLTGVAGYHGHVCVFDRIDAEKGEIWMVDPSRNSPKWWSAPVSKFFAAMKKHGAALSGGVVELVAV